MPLPERLPQEGEFVPGELLVRYKDVDALKKAPKEKGDKHNGPRKRRDGESNATRLYVKPGEEAKTIEKLEKRGDIKTAEFNLIGTFDHVPTDPAATAGRQNSVLGTPAQFGAHLFKLWDYNKTWAAGQWSNIAVIDSGFNMYVSELDYFLAHSGLQKIQDHWNFADNNSTMTDGLNHGTKMATIAAGRWNNNVGISGVAPLAHLYLYKIDPVASPGALNMGAAADAVEWAASGTVEERAHVINMSFSFRTFLQDFQDALTYAAGRGSVCVSSAGNVTNTGTNYIEANPPIYPARMNYCYGTAWGLDFSDNVAKTSYVGDHVYWTVTGNNTRGIDNAGNEVSVSGTSPAAAIASGINAILYAGYGGLAHQRVNHLAAKAKDIHTAGWDKISGYGRLDAYKAAWTEYPTNFTPLT